MFSSLTFTPSQQRGAYWFLLISSLGLLAVAVLRANRQAHIPPISAHIAWESFRMHPLDINTADSSAFEALPGIGPKTARRIIHYRNKVGGFASIQALEAVYGLQAATIAENRPYWVVHEATYQALQAKKPTDPFSQAIPKLDLNLATATQLDRLPGIGKVLSTRIVRFRQAKKGFATVAELQNVYGLPPETYAKIKPYLYITPAARPASDAVYKAEPDPAKALQVDLNSATASELEQIPGIGPKLSTRIVKFRARLGFFHDLRQLNAIYGLSAENYARMAPHLTIQMPVSIQKENLNIMSAYDLARFPSVSKAQAQRIVQVRISLGMFSDWDELKTSVHLPASTVAELKIYTRIF